MFKIFSPSKLILTGEHSVVYNKKCIVSTISLGTTFSVHKSDSRFVNYFLKEKVHCYREGDPVNNRTEQALELFYRLLNDHLVTETFSIDITSTVPHGAGLGSSASFSVGLATVLKHFIDLDILSTANRFESIFHSSASGVDTFAILNGGTFIYSKSESASKLHFNQRLFICDTKIEHNTSTLVKHVREIYEKYGKALIDEIGDITEEVIQSIENGSFSTDFMDRNHVLLRDLGVSNEAIEAIVSIAQNYKINAKITGAGGGGCVLLSAPVPGLECIEVTFTDSGVKYLC